jgi:hypothetical protein
MSTYAIFDEALESIVAASPDLRNGLTNHAPMAIEALCAMGRDDAVMPWLDNYRAGMQPWPASRERIDHANWREALGHLERVADWRAFFDDELKEVPWREMLDRWAARFAPAVCASAMHGVLRVGHVTRALTLAETPARIAELGDGLAYWAATYQTLPTDLSAQPATIRPSEAILQVAIVPPQQRKFTGTIVSSLERLDEFPAFAPVIGLADLNGDPSLVLSSLTETFARVYLANARDVLSTIVFIHGVTGAVALRSLAPHLREQTVREALRYVWQAGCGLYAAFGHRPAPEHEIEPLKESRETLIDMAVANGDEHAIKFTEACLREHALNPSPVYLSAARHALDILKG